MQTSGVKTASANSLGNVSTMAAGDSCTVSITDPRYGKVCSISTTKDCAGVCDGDAKFVCPTGYQSSSCSTGYYTYATAAKYCNKKSSVTDGTCYICKQCTYSCPSGYYTSAGTGYHLTSSYKYQVCNGDSSQTNSTKCYTREANSCSYYGYEASTPSGKTCTPVTINSGSSTKTCYKDCKAQTYKITVTVTGKSSVAANGCSYGINLWSGEYSVSVNGTYLCSGSANQDWNVSCSGEIDAKNGDTVSVSASHVEWWASSASGGPSCTTPGPIPGPNASGTSTLSISNGNGSAFVTLN